MVKHTQTIRRQIADELFECVWPFCEIGAWRVKVIELYSQNQLLYSYIQSFFPADIYLLKVYNRTPEQSVKCSVKLTIKTPKRRQWRRYGVFVVNFEHISHLVPVFLLLTLNMKLPAGLSIIQNN